METVVALTVLAILAVTNGVATWVAVRDRYAERRHKAFQVLAVWLIPVFGAILIFALYRKPEKAMGHYREPLDVPRDDVASGRYVGHGIDIDADHQP